MIRFLGLISSLIFFIGCCKSPDIPHPNKADIKPIWAQKLTIGSSRYIWNEGLCSIIFNNETVIFNTTLSIENNCEDNRLCGLDVRTGAIKWMFPSDKTQKYNNLFNGKAYLQDNTLFVKSPSLFAHPENEILAIDLINHNLKFKYSLPYNNWDNNCYGNSGYLVWEENTEKSAKIYLMNIENREAEIIINHDHNSGYDIKLSVINVNNTVLTFLEQGFRDTKYGKYICKYDLKNKTLLNRKKIPIEYNGYLLAFKTIYDNTAYFIMGPYICAFNFDNGEMVWNTDINEYPDYHQNDLVVYGDFVFSSGENMYMCLDRNSGKILYKKNVHGCKWICENDGYAYANILGKIHVINMSNGDILDTLVCPEENIDGEGFNMAIKAGFSLNNIYIMSYTTGYCYPKYPW